LLAQVSAQERQKFVQVQWRAAWEANKDRIYWDKNARCFRLMLVSSREHLAGS
jgi:hypothetical protein